MKSCVFIAFIIVFLNCILIEKSHCAAENKTDTDIEDNKNITIVLANEELVHALNNVGLDNISEIYENSTDFTNDSSVAGARKTDITETKSNTSPSAEEQKKSDKGNEAVKDKHSSDGEKDSWKGSDAQLSPTATKALPPKNVKVLPTVATTVLINAAPKTTSPKDVKQAEESTEKTVETTSSPHSNLGQDTGGEPPKSISDQKPSDKKTQVETTEEKDTIGDEGQPDIDSLNDDIQTNDKKESPALTPDEKQPAKAPSEHVENNDKKVADVLPKPVFPEQENSHFFVYFMTVVAICVLGYFLFHNKQKIIALIVEGRHDRRRRAHSYRKLETEGTKGSPAIF